MYQFIFLTNFDFPVIVHVFTPPPPPPTFQFPFYILKHSYICNRKLNLLMSEFSLFFRVLFIRLFIIVIIFWGELLIKISIRKDQEIEFDILLQNSRKFVTCVLIYSVSLHVVMCNLKGSEIVHAKGIKKNNNNTFFNKSCAICRKFMKYLPENVIH